jgi:hypothetical protein
MGQALDCGFPKSKHDTIGTYIDICFAKNSRWKKKLL